MEAFLLAFQWKYFHQWKNHRWIMKSMNTILNNAGKTSKNQPKIFTQNLKTGGKQILMSYLEEVNH